MPYAAPARTELLDILGAGSVFHVALVRADNQTLICKRLTPRMVREHAGRAAIVREARALSLAKHPALPTLVALGSDAHGPFILETRVPGVPLRALVEGWRARGQRVPPRLVGHIARLAILALAEVHELADETGPIGLTHGDLGPEHVLFGPLGEVGFIDLGAARFRGMEEALATDDRGTLPFVAPEVARGEAPPSAPTGDLYALAATLLYLATGGPLCNARDEPAMLVEIGERGIRIELLEQADAFTPAERAALRAALAVDPGARLSTARALYAAFEDERTPR